MGAVKPSPVPISDARSVLSDALSSLQNQGLVVHLERERPAIGRGHADALVNIAYGEAEPALYVVEIKHWLTPATLGPVVSRLRELGPATLLVTDYVTPQVALRLKELDIAFADTVGNAYLKGPNFMVSATGRRQGSNRRTPRMGRAWQPTGLKLIFALLCNPDWIGVDYRNLAARSGVSNGTVGWVMRELSEQGFVVQVRSGAKFRRLRNRRKLLDRWVEIYAGTFRGTTLLGRYHTENTDWWRTLGPSKYDACIGGESAAAILTEYLKPEIVTVYVNIAPANMLVDYQMRAASEANVEIRQRFWPFEYKWDHPELTPPVLVYADLLATGDARCIEAARRVYDGYLAGLIGQD